MEIEFNGISSNTLHEICNNHGVNVEVFPLASRDTICSREKGRTFGGGETYYLAEESCWHGYYFCGGYQCGRASSHPAGRRGPSVQTKPRRKTSRSADCSGSGDCGTSSDSAGALIIFFLIIAIFLLLIFLAPIIGPLVALGIELGLALLLGVFDLLTFGVFRKKFKRVIVYFPTPPSNAQLDRIIGDASSLGGLPRRFQSRYGTNGFWLLRTGAYLFIPSLVATLLVLWLQPESRVLFYVPIIAFLCSMILVWFGNSMINRKANKVAQMR